MNVWGNAGVRRVGMELGQGNHVTTTGGGRSATHGAETRALACGEMRAHRVKVVLCQVPHMVVVAVAAGRGIFIRPRQTKVVRVRKCPSRLSPCRQRRLSAPGSARPEEQVPPRKRHVIHVLNLSRVHSRQQSVCLFCPNTLATPRH